MISQFNVVLVSLDPTVGSEIEKTRPCVIISPDDMNKYLSTIIIAPMTSKGFKAKFRVPILFNKVNGIILLDQIRVIDKMRIVRQLGRINEKSIKITKAILAEMFI